ncbi:PQQ-dependent sugar dehydrogenase [Rhodoferax bucti]|uniref:PQQ-dependent sugar dehydrogenase n=1 Tax=Rhodoferax bucti TaxID=2576305 RepID=UPI0011091636|nr:PQQ-dependent sugar dehydrogenase [Rhodoferax bucti]
MIFTLSLPARRASVAVGLALCTWGVQADALRTETVASGLEHPWALAFLPDGQFLVTERPGRLRVVDAQGRVGPPIRGVPAVDARGQGGLLDVLLDSDFARNRQLYLCYAEPGAGGNSTAMARARLSEDTRSLTDVQVIFSQQPKVASNAHFGCRIAEGQRQGASDGSLYLALGERFSRKDDAQRLDNHHGKMIRIHKDGGVPTDNPFAGASTRPAGARPEIWSYGHRNPQGLVQAPDGTLWEIEHGPQGGDEINLLQAGRNYGWPVITYGENYGGGPIGSGLTAQAGMEQPLHHWTPSIAPSGMAFVTSARYGKAWTGNLVVGSLKFGYLARLELSAPFAGTMLRETRHLQSLGERVRDVRQGPDGWLYLLTDQAPGRLLRVLPR